MPTTSKNRGKFLSVLAALSGQTLGGSPVSVASPVHIIAVDGPDTIPGVPSVTPEEPLRFSSPFARLLGKVSEEDQQEEQFGQEGEEFAVNSVEGSTLNNSTRRYYFGIPGNNDTYAAVGWDPVASARSESCGLVRREEPPFADWSTVSPESVDMRFLGSWLVTCSKVNVLTSNGSVPFNETETRDCVESKGSGCGLPNFNSPYPLLMVVGLAYITVGLGYPYYRDNLKGKSLQELCPRLVGLFSRSERENLDRPLLHQASEESFASNSNNGEEGPRQEAKFSTSGSGS
ncbi:MAG: hypothetical protein K0Q74_746 [Gammaproteobacteria bacterium]|nr:hypothetical protein [Gammaproteobacteria bacterium]